ncbi:MULTISPECIES: CD1375 family protein [Erysipelotrichales]|nr:MULTISPECIES: CD1375 family protein [Erysipelotrichales]
MAKVYYELIIKGLKTIDDVPEKLKEQVQELLDSDSNDN